MYDEFNDVKFINATDEVKEIVEGIKASFGTTRQDRFVKKASFSPSRLAWGAGGCPRNWHFLFNGLDMVEVHDSDSLDTMQNGTDAHARMQKRIKEGPLDITVEEQLRYSDPPINSFCDIIVERPDGSRVPIEIKTSKTEAFMYRHASLSPAEYHVFQLLCYMKILGATLGFIMYEDKNDYRKLLLPVYMDDDNKKLIDDAFDWMREVRAAYDEGKIPDYFPGRRKNSKICGQCDFKPVCDEAGKGSVQIPLLKDYRK